MYQISLKSGDLLSLFLNKNDSILANELAKLKETVSGVSDDMLLFHINSTIMLKQRLATVVDIIKTNFPNSQIALHTTAGNVSEYEYHSGINISVIVFEDESTKCVVEQYDLGDDSECDIASEILRFASKNSWVKAIELHHTLGINNMTDLCESLSYLPKGVRVFGGLVCSEDWLGTLSLVGTHNKPLSDAAAMVTYYGGDNFHAETYRISGWKPIKKVFTVTKSDRNYIREIDSKPAYEIYKRYLNIDNDENLFVNLMEFPLFCEWQGEQMILDPLQSDEKGSLRMPVDIHEGTKCCLSYGEPSLIIDDIRQKCSKIKEFTPDVLSITSCFARDSFWSNRDYICELQPFESIADCYGYLSAGEFIRENEKVHHHNTVLIIGAMREGPVQDLDCSDVVVETNSSVPLVSRLGTFISSVTEELEESYSKIADMNRELEKIATIDSLTGIGNRFMFDDAVRVASKDLINSESKYLFMFDVNGLKFVNDTFGHSEGDILIKSAATAIDTVFSEYGSCFRIGGDEFAAVLSFNDKWQIQSAEEKFEAYVENYNKQAAYILSIAYGYSPLIDTHGEVKSSSDWKMDADINMYRNKAKFHAIKSESVHPDVSDFIVCIMSLLDNKNKYMAYHSVRVQRMAIKIAHMMHLDEEFIGQLSTAAYVHDIGRLGITETVYAKNGILTGDDIALIRQSPSIGKKILMQTDTTKPIADIVLHHHECWDGSGYPDGIAGEEIPLASRIIAIADSIDAMLNKRQYRDALSVGECYKELEINSGKMYDPNIISIVLANFTDIVKDGLAMDHDGALSDEE